MNLSGRLIELVGHEITVVTCNMFEEPKTPDVPEVILEEVGEDYLLVQGQLKENRKYHESGRRRFVNLTNVVYVLHEPDCRKCTEAKKDILI